MHRDTGVSRLMLRGAGLIAKTFEINDAGDQQIVRRCDVERHATHLHHEPSTRRNRRFVELCSSLKLFLQVQLSTQAEPQISLTD